MRLHIAQVNVADMEVARRFYTEVLGFSIRKDEGIVELEHSGAILLLYPAKEISPVEYGKHAGFQLCFSVSDLQATIDRLRSLDVQFVFQEPMTCPYGKFVSILDPSGNVIEIMEPHP